MLQNPSLWSSLTSCFTTAVLFLLLNLTIIAIALISSFTRSHHHHHNPHHDSHDHVKIFRSPSILQRLKSINFYAISPEPPKPNPNFFSENDHFNHDDSQIPDSQIAEDPSDNHFASDNAEDENKLSMDEIYSRLNKGVQFGRTKSDTEPRPGFGLARGPARIRKSARMKPKPPPSAADAVEARRPATVRERVLAKVTDGDEGVDAKADDFINKFKQQLQLQRLDSILKYRDKIKRGFGGGR